MTINNTSVRTTVQGNSAQTVFNYPFEVPAAGDATLYLTQISTDTTIVVAPSLWSMTGIGNAGGGTFTYPLSGGAPISSDYKLTLVRTAPYANLTALANQAGYYPQSVEDALDFLAMQTQQLAAMIEQTIRLPRWDANMNTLLSKAALPNTLLGFDGSGDPIPVAGVTPPSVAVTPFMETLLDDPNAATARATLGAAAANIVPAGAMLSYAGAAAPALWLLCSGQAISRTAYTALFDAIGTTWGAGDGTTTFNVPDLRGRVPFHRDYGTGRLTFAVSNISGDTLGAVGGDQRMQQHLHTITDPGHFHNQINRVSDDGYVAGSSPAWTGQTATPVSTNTTGITINNAGTGNSQNIPPAAVTNWIIYAGV